MQPQALPLKQVKPGLKFKLGFHFTSSRVLPVWPDCHLPGKYENMEVSLLRETKTDIFHAKPMIWRKSLRHRADIFIITGAVDQKDRYT